MIKQLMLQGLEKSTNVLLNMDLDNKKKLHSLTNNSFEIEISDWNFIFYLEITHKHISLNTTSDLEPICHIKGKLWDFIALTKPNAPKISQKSLSISGDIEAAQQLQIILKNHNIDWEEQLSKITGDSIAHHIGTQSKRAFNFTTNAMQSIQKNITEFIQHEKKLLPTQPEIEKFYSKISELRDDTERLMAKIDILLPGKQ